MTALGRAGFLAGVLVLSGCSAGPTQSPVPAVDATPPSFAGAPAAVRQRTTLPPCGVDTAVRNGARFTVADTSARACFWTAYLRGQPAELIGTLRTDSGGLVTVITRSLGSGRVELFIDNTQLPGSDLAWTLLTCNGLQAINDSPVKPDWAPGIPPSVGCTTTTLAP
ncbi:MAG TPA: hypothetical protein VF484_10280 [Candidatus Limnocylindrales bacterium]